MIKCKFDNFQYWALVARKEKEGGTRRNRRRVASLTIDKQQTLLLYILAELPRVS